MSKQIYIVAIDGSEWSDRAAARAISLAEKTGAQVHFVTVVALVDLFAFKTAEIPEKGENRDKFESQTQKDIFDPLVEKYAKSNVQIKYDILWGHPVEKIHKQAKKEHASMIFVGRRGRSKVADLVLGSVAHSLAHTAGIPIVLVP